MGQKEAWSASCSEGCGQQGGGVKKLICAREIYNMLLIWNKNIQGIWLYHYGSAAMYVGGMVYIVVMISL